MQGLGLVQGLDHNSNITGHVMFSQRKDSTTTNSTAYKDNVFCVSQYELVCDAKSDNYFCKIIKRGQPVSFRIRTNSQ